MKKLKITGMIFIAAILVIGCGTSSTAEDVSASDPGDVQPQDGEGDAPGAPSSEKQDGITGDDFAGFLASNTLVVTEISAHEDQETVGEILTMHLVNQSGDVIETTIPCGLVFTPDDSSEQPLMLIQPLQVSLAAGEEIDLQPFVVCIDLGTAAPAFGSGYSVGYTAGGNLMQFAQCLCGEEIDTELGSLDSVGVQFATWAISIDGDIDNFITENEEFATSEAAAEMGVDEFAGYFSGIMDTFGQEWLDRCGIVPGDD